MEKGKRESELLIWVSWWCDQERGPANPTLGYSVISRKCIIHPKLYLALLLPLFYSPALSFLLCQSLKSSFFPEVGRSGKVGYLEYRKMYEKAKMKSLRIKYKNASNYSGARIYRIFFSTDNAVNFLCKRRKKKKNSYALEKKELQQTWTSFGNLSLLRLIHRLGSK